MKTLQAHLSLLDALEKGPALEELNSPSTPSLIHDFLSTGDMVHINAYSGGTWTACEFARGLAEGNQVLGKFQCAHSAGVLALQGSMSHDQFVARLDRLITDKNHAPIKVISPTHFTADSRPDLCDAVQQDEFLSWLKKNAEYQILILDDVGAFLAPKPESKQIDRFLTMLRNASITLINIQSRGKGGLPLPWNYADVILDVRRIDAGPGLVLRINFEKARGLKQEQQTGFFLKLAEDDNGSISFTEAVMDDFLKARTVQLLARGWTQDTIAEETGKDQSTISRWINKSLLPNSLLAKDGRRFLLTDAGRRMLSEHGLSPEA